MILDKLEHSHTTLQLKANEQPNDLEKGRIYAVTEMTDICKGKPDEYVECLRTSSPSVIMTSTSTTSTLIHRLKIVTAILNMIEVLDCNYSTPSNIIIRQHSEKLLDDLLSITSSLNSTDVNDLRTRLALALGSPTTGIPSSTMIPSSSSSSLPSSTSTTTTTTTNFTMDNGIDIVPTAPSITPTRILSTITPGTYEPSGGGGGSTVFPFPSSSSSHDITNHNNNYGNINASADTNSLRTQLHQTYNEIAHLREQLATNIAHHVQGKDPSLSSQISTLQLQIQAATKNEQDARNETIMVRQQLESLTVQYQKLTEEKESLISSKHNLEQILNASSNLRDDLQHVQQELEAREKIIASLRSAGTGTTTTTTNASRRGTLLSTTTTALISPEEENNNATNVSVDSTTPSNTKLPDLSSLTRILKGDINSIRMMKEDELLHIQENLQDIMKAISRRLMEYHEETVDQSLCIICVTNKKNAVLVPCGHLCICNDCTVMLKQTKPPKCPVCRIVVEDTKIVYT